MGLASNGEAPHSWQARSLYTAQRAGVHNKDATSESFPSDAIDQDGIRRLEYSIAYQAEIESKPHVP